MMPPRLVIFDMDDVLCHYDLGRRLRSLSALSGQTPRDIRAMIWDSGFEDAADSGGYPDAEAYLHEFGRRLNYPITRAEWLAARRSAMLPFAEVLELAQQIGKRAALAIYTNNGPLVKHGLPELFPEAAAVFPRIFCSYEFGTKKPDPMSYTRLLAQLAVPPAECWFIDDKRSNVVGARMAGLKAHHYRHFAPLLAEAQSLELLV